jgi:AraC-like DNA-binding protein
VGWGTGSLLVKSPNYGGITVSEYPGVSVQLVNCSKHIMREFYYPDRAELKKHVKYISFHKPDDNEKKELFVFPNPGTAIALHRDMRFERSEKNTYKVVGTPGIFTQLLHINRIDPVKVIDTVKKENITIVFNPSGVNHYIWGNLSDLVKGNRADPSYIPLEKFFSYQDFSKNVFSIRSRKEQLTFIGEYLLKKYSGVEIPMVEEAVSLLTDIDRSYSIAEICSRLGTSPRNLTRLFNKHICLSPVEFRNVFQFRYSLEKKIEKGNDILYKDISYESNYATSSYMIRMYKKYTGLNPSSFFDKVSIDGKYVFLSL